MVFLSKAWNSVKHTIINHCFNYAGFWSGNEDFDEEDELTLAQMRLRYEQENQSDDNIPLSQPYLANIVSEEVQQNFLDMVSDVEITGNLSNKEILMELEAGAQGDTDINV